MQADDFETAIKVVVVGNGNVGKSSLIRRFCKSEYIQNYKKTIGVEYQERDLVLKNNNNERVKIMVHQYLYFKQILILKVWDCAGQEEFDTITKDYYKEADAVILAFSTVDRQSFEMVKGWRNKLAGTI